MHTTLRTLCLLAILVSLPPTIAAAEPQPTTPQAAAATTSEYTISVIPFYGPEKIWALYTPFIDFLKESTGKPWALKLFATHKALIDGLCTGQVSLALLGPVPMGKVMEQCQAEPLLVARAKDGTPYYRSIVVSIDPMITSLTGLKGTRFGLFKGSTAAHILPRQILRQAGIQKGDIVPVFFESQDHIVNALLSRQISAAGLKEALFQKFKDVGFRVLATSEPLPNFAFAAAPAAHPAVKELFTQTLLRLQPATNEADKKRMATWDDEIKNGFIPPPDTFRAAVKDLLVITDEIMREDR
jgi:phosphonate transport system substrate-binding protein